MTIPSKMSSQGGFAVVNKDGVAGGGSFLATSTIPEGEAEAAASEEQIQKAVLSNNLVVVSPLYRIPRTF